MYFYNKKVEIWKRGEQEHIGGGIYKEGKEEKIKTLKMDIQPYSASQAKRDYGFDVDLSHYAFSADLSLEIEGNFIVYKGDKYDIKEKIEWDDYAIYFLDRRR